MWAFILLLGVLPFSSAATATTNTTKDAAEAEPAEVSKEHGADISANEFGWGWGSHCTPSRDISSYFTSQNSHYKYFIPRQPSVTWEGALAACKSICAELTTVDDEAEFDHLNVLILESGRVDNSFWTAGTNLRSHRPSHSHSDKGIQSNGHSHSGWDHGSGYFWVTFGEPVKHFYPKHTGQPDNFRGYEHCINLQKSFTGGTRPVWIMNDAYCNGEILYICRREL